MLMNPREEALVRGWIEQIPYPTLARLYLDSPDPLHARTTVSALRERLAHKARRSRRSDLQIFWLDGHPDTPSVDPKDRDGTATSGALSHWQKHARLALDQLMGLPEPTPNLDDPVALWLSARVAKALTQAGFETLRAVHAAIAEQGRYWWTAIPGVGPGSGRSALQLFKSMGVDPTQKALPSARTDGVEVTLRGGLSHGAHATLDGSQGVNRERQRRCQLSAADDFQAIQAWLSLRDHHTGTYRHYRREAERFLLWCLLKKKKAFSSVNTLDCADYLKFIEAPDPDWLGPYGVGRGNDHWKPFRAKGCPGLSRGSQKLVRTVLNALCAWLVAQAYLESNPFSGLPKMKLRPRTRAHRALTMKQWRWLLDYGQRRIAEAERGKHQRMLFILCFAYETGLRLHELARAQAGDIEADTSATGEAQWWLGVVGKGAKTRDVPISGDLMTLLNEHLASRGYPSVGSCDSAVPLIGRARLKATGPYETPAYVDAPLSESGLHYLLTRYFKEAAQALADTDAKAAEHLAEATAHWLRHSYATHAVAAGVPLDVLRENLGHEDLATTSLYVRAARDRQYQETTGRHRAKSE